MIVGIRETLPELIGRAESGTGGDRELDCLLDAVLDGRSISESGNMILARNSRPPHDTYILGWIDPGKTSRNFSEGPSRPPVPRYTTSLDAVVDLLVRRLPAITDNSAADFLAASIDEMMVRGWRPSEPNIPQICRAVLAAFLRALEEARTLADAHSKNPPEAEHG